MNLTELYNAVNEAIQNVHEFGDNPDEVIVSIQVETDTGSVWSNDVDLHYDCDTEYSGCVIIGEQSGQQ